MSAKFDEAALPEGLRRGLAAIRARVAPTAGVVAIQDNFAYVGIGVQELPDLYVEDRAELFVRAPLTFPHAAPYGIITRPFLHRKDGAAIDRQHLNHDLARPVGNGSGGAELGFWSWDWSGMPCREPEDLAAIVEWARKRLRQG